MTNANVEFKDFTVEVKGTMDQLAYTVLEEVAGEMEAQVKRNHDTLNIVDTGQTKNSWTHNVKSEKDEHKATIGSPLENAIWEEFGTGEYALYGNGRKGGWFYVDEEDNGHFTHGKAPRRPFYKAYTSMKNKIIKHIQEVFKGGMK